MTDDVYGSLDFRDPENLNPEYVNIGGRDLYEGGEHLDHEKYLKYKAMLVFGDHVVDQSLFQFTRKGIILPAAGAKAPVPPPASPDR